MNFPVALLAWLLTAMTITSCFKPDYVCSYCSPSSSRQCPAESLFCRKDNLCVPVVDASHFCPNPSNDASQEDTDVASRDGSEGRADDEAGGGANADVGATDTPEETGDDAPATLVCRDQCCVGPSCFPLSEGLKRNLILWADRTTLGKQGFPLKKWPDRSGAGRDIMSVNVDFDPTVGVDPAGSILSIQDPHTALIVGGPDFEFGADDFTVLILARCDPAGTRSVLFEKISTGTTRPRTGISLFCNHTGVLLGPSMPVHAMLMITDDFRYPDIDSGTITSTRTNLPGGLHLFGARRVGGTRVQLRVDKNVDAELEVVASLSLSDSVRTSIVTSIATTANTFSGGIAAALVIKGLMSDQEVNDLEDFLIRSLGIAPDRP